MVPSGTSAQRLRSHGIPGGKQLRQRNKYDGSDGILCHVEHFTNSRQLCNREYDRFYDEPAYHGYHGFYLVVCGDFHDDLTAQSRTPAAAGHRFTGQPDV